MDNKTSGSKDTTNTGKTFEILKIAIEKLLLLGVLVSTAYFAQHVIGKMETRRITKEKFQERKFEIAQNLAVHCSDLLEKRAAFDLLTAEFVEAIPTDNIQSVELYLQSQIMKILITYRDNLIKLQNDIPRYRAKVELFLGAEVLNSYNDFLFNLFPYYTFDKFSSLIVKFDKIDKQLYNNESLQNMKIILKKYYKSLRSDESIGNKYQNLISKLAEIIYSDLDAFSEPHPRVADNRYRTGLNWYSKGQYDKAIEYLERELMFDTIYFGENHPNVARDCNNLGDAWRKKGHYDKAIEYYEKSFESFKKSGLLHHAATVEESIKDLRK